MRLKVLPCKMTCSFSSLLVLNFYIGEDTRLDSSTFWVFPSQPAKSLRAWPRHQSVVGSSCPNPSFHWTALLTVTASRAIVHCRNCWYRTCLSFVVVMIVVLCRHGVNVFARWSSVVNSRKSVGGWSPHKSGLLQTAQEEPSFSRHASILLKALRDVSCVLKEACEHELNVRIATSDRLAANMKAELCRERRARLVASMRVVPSIEYQQCSRGPWTM